MHVVIDNYAAPEHDNVTKWLEHPSRKDRRHIHFVWHSTTMSAASRHPG